LGNVQPLIKYKESTFNNSTKTVDLDLSRRGSILGPPSSPKNLRRDNEEESEGNDRSLAAEGDART
jgi:hypothetical protein